MDLEIPSTPAHAAAAGYAVPPWGNPKIRSRCWLFCSAFPSLFVPMIWLQLPLPETISTPQFGILFWTLTLCAGTDIRWRKIPNWATYPALIWLISIALFRGVSEWVQSMDPGRMELPSSPTFWTSFELLGSTIAGGLACFCVMFFVFRMAGGGAGDVKLATVIGAALGVDMGFAALVSSYIFAAVAILTWLTWTVGPRLVVATFARKIGHALFPMVTASPRDAEEQMLQRRVALGPFFAIGTLVIALRIPEMWE